MRIEGYPAQELFARLNDLDETENVEAKSLAEDSTRSIMETVCSFSNEPGLGGGVILLGVAENRDSDFPRYVVENIADTDKAQLDFASRCASMFNFPVRPEIYVEKIRGKNVLRIFVPELPAPRKPLYFKNEGIPKGIFRRIGSSDQRCSEEDLPVFYTREDACDHSPVPGAHLSDVDEEEVARYRILRGKVRPDATELSFDTPRLLKALGCLDREDPTRLNLAGALLFGTGYQAKLVHRVAGKGVVDRPHYEIRAHDVRALGGGKMREHISREERQFPPHFAPLDSRNLDVGRQVMKALAMREALHRLLFRPRLHVQHKPTAKPGRIVGLGFAAVFSRQ